VVKELDMTRLNAGDQFLSNASGQWVVETV